jgi:hypothetical protein
MTSDDVTLLTGCVVTRVSFDYQVILLLVDGPFRKERVSAHLVIEAPIELRDLDAAEHEVLPGEPRTLAPMLHLLHRKLTGRLLTDGRSPWSSTTDLC